MFCIDEKVEEACKCVHQLFTDIQKTCDPVRSGVLGSEYLDSSQVSEHEIQLRAFESTVTTEVATISFSR
jgi:hypothetical protein